MISEDPTGTSWAVVDPPLSAAEQRHLDVVIDRLLTHRSGPAWRDQVARAQRTGRAIGAPEPGSAADDITICSAAWTRRWNVTIDQLTTAVDYLEGAGTTDERHTPPASLDGLPPQALEELVSLRTRGRLRDQAAG